jgi:NADH-quinone oxidoreductase subunit I
MLSYVNDILDGLKATVTGLRTTFDYAVENWTGNGAVTINYPEVPAKPAERFRGHLVNKSEDCIVCRLCEKACPVDCFLIDGERNEQGKLRASLFDIDLTKCIYCGLCVRACPVDCLTFSHIYTTAPEHHDQEWSMRFLFRARPDQASVKLTSFEVAQLTAMGHTPREQLNDADLALLDRLEDPLRGTVLMGRYGLGYYTPEEKARVDAIREAEKQRKAAEEVAKKAAAEAAKAAEAATSTPGDAKAVP